MSQSTNHTHNQNSDGSYHCYACLKEGATDYDADADGFTRGTIPADERIASRKLAQGSTNPKDDLDEMLLQYEISGKDGIAREEFLTQMQEYVTLARTSEVTELLKQIKPEDKHSGASWQRGYVSAQMKLRKLLKSRLAALQRDSQPGDTA